MGLFKRKYTLEEIIEGFNSLSNEEKEQIRRQINGENSGEADKEPAPEEPVIETPTKEAPEENDNQAEDIPNPPTEEGAEDNAEGNVEEPTDAPTESPATETESENEQELENAAKMIQALTERVNTLESSLSAFNDLKAKMEEYTKKQEERFGYHSNTQGEHEDLDNMSADELSAKIRHGI